MQNTINAVGALLLVTVYYYKELLCKNLEGEKGFKEVFRQLEPESRLIKIAANYYFHYLVVSTK